MAHLHLSHTGPSSSSPHYYSSTQAHLYPTTGPSSSRQTPPSSHDRFHPPPTCPSSSCYATPPSTSPTPVELSPDETDEISEWLHLDLITCAPNGDPLNPVSLHEREGLGKMGLGFLGAEDHVLP
ncbi:hypothetical protein Scep_019337 [Stephania cephalantha]|uniref:Uncharacterized protein n=1 Tax=Stephania cephalantha TaxID=152367 RepID=A0AAP0NM22_9MAGN